MVDAPTRVLVVDDSVAFRGIISRALGVTPGVEVVGVAANGKLALQKIDQLRPDALTLDVEMPEMNGLQVLDELARRAWAPGVVMLSAFTREGAAATLAALERGAFDFVLKPSSSSLQANFELLQRELASKLNALARSRALRRVLRGETRPIGSRPAAGPTSGPAPRAPAATTAAAATSTSAARVVASTAPGPLASAPSPPRPRPAATRAQVVAIGVSTGGPKALTELLPRLPEDLPAPVLVVQHMPPMFTKTLAEDLDRRCKLRVCEAENGQIVTPGRVYIAPGGFQMKLERRDARVLIRITDDPPVCNCRPSVDYLFESVAENYGGASLGVILTGMGNDGTRGGKLLKQRGAAIAAQDAASCVVFGMPRDAVENGWADCVGPLDVIALEISRLTAQGTPRCV